MKGHLAGLLAGLAATVPMTAAMEMMHRRLPRSQRQPLPPRQITMRAADEVGLKQHLDEPERTAATLASHFAYGAAAGAAYVMVARRAPGHPAVKGAVFGLAVWAASYLGWLPALGILPPATEQPARRNALMIVAHLIWGAATGVLAERLQSPNKEG